MQSRKRFHDQILRDHLFATKSLDFMSVGDFLSQQELNHKIEKAIIRLPKEKNCYLPFLASLFFLNGDTEKGLSYSREAYQTACRMFGSSKISEHLIAITEAIQTDDLITAFEINHDLFTLLETNYSVTDYPLLKTLTLMKAVWLSNRLNAIEFREYYMKKLSDSPKFADVMKLFSEGNCSLEAYLNNPLVHYA